jgi:hypothetical protein
MRHETALKYLDELDAGQEPSIALRMHLAACPSCARQAKRAAEALAAYRSVDSEEEDLDALTLSADRLLEDRIMAAIRLTPPPRQDFAIRDWLLPAIVILVSLCLLPLASSLGFLESLFGSGSAISLALVLGIAFTGYSVFFIATHLNELETYLQKRGVPLR